MNGKSFYLEIGNIDDDLIEGASKAGGSRWKAVGKTSDRGADKNGMTRCDDVHHVRRLHFTRLVGLAACLCLICLAMFWNRSRDIIYYNEAPAPRNSKVAVPSDENTVVLMLTYQELFDYYGLKPFPDVLSGLGRLKQTYYFVYQSQDKTIYDTNLLNYCSDDGKQMVTVSVGTDEDDGMIQGEEVQEEAKESRIDGVSLVLAVSEEMEEPVYWAKISDQGLSVRVVSYGLDEAAFTDVIRELIQCQK